MEKEILYKYFEGTTTPEEETAVYRWLDASPDHEKEFFREREFFDTMLLSGRLECDRADKIEKMKKPASFFKHPFVREALKIAAVAIIMLTCGLYFNVSERKELLSAMNTITVPAGQRVNLKLPDGTIVWLNARSEIVYPAVFSSSKREVKLDGEAYFEVAHAVERPFIVHTKKCNVEVLGTKFNVEAYSDSDDFVTSLMEGSVSVTDNSRPSSVPVLLKPKQEASMKDGSLQVSAIDDYDHFRWREGVISFKNMAFNEVMNRFEKCYGISIVLENNTLDGYSCSGKFRIADGLDNALRILQRNAHYTFERNEENTIVYIK